MFQLVIDNIPQFIFWKDRNSVYLGGNANFAKVAGLSSAAELPGKTDFDLAWTREQAEFFRSVDQRVMASGKPEYRIIEPQTQADGKDAWLETNKIPLFDQAGEVVGILGTYEDITERIESVNALREREENLRVTLNAIAEGVIATDADGRITRMNPVAERLLRLTEAEARGRFFDDVYQTRADDTSATTRRLFELVRREDSVKASHEVLLMVNGQIIGELAETASPIHDDQDEFNGMVVVIRDVSLKRNMEAQLRHAQKMDAIGQLAGGIAHDFNNMLTGIMGAAELLETELQGKPEALQLLSLLSRTAQKAAGLTGKLLTFSRRGRMVSARLDMHTTIEDAIEILRRSVDRRIDIRLRLEAEHTTIQGDPAELETALLNLGINARDAMPEGGLVTITTENVELDAAFCSSSPFDLTPGRFLQISVEDTGCGISVEDQVRIFEPFFSTKPVGEGTGLGLAAVYGAVAGHKGGIVVYSERNQGSVFHILLPVVDAPAQAPGASLPHQMVRGEGTVLVVDDEDVLRSTARLMLEDLGYQVLQARDGSEALSVFREEHATIDAVLLDVIMPGIDGHACFEEMRKIRPNARIVMASGFTHEDIINDVMAKGARGFLKKPYRKLDLSAAIARALADPPG